MSGAIDTNELGNHVRYWVYCDDTICKLNKDIRNLRATKDKYELAIIQRLKAAKQERAILQIVGGRIQIVEDKQAQNLCYKNLQEMLHDYYKQKPPPVRDETDEIIKFLKGHRQTTTSERLRRHNTG
jgi:hypothetical protein